MRNGWTETTLGEVADIQKGKKPPEVDVFVPLSKPYLTADVLRGATCEQFISDVLAGSCIHLSGHETVLLWDGAGAGDVFKSQPGILASTMAKVQSKSISVIVDGYLYLYLDSKRVEIKSSCRGTTVPHVSPEALKSLSFFLPPLAEQKRIVDVVSSVDAYINALQQQVDTARTSRSAVLHELLSAGGDDWTETTLGDISDTRLGKMLSATTDDGSGALHPYLRNANVRWGEVDLSDLKEMRFSQKDCETFSLLAGDLLICEGGEPGRTALLKKDLPGIYFQKAIHRVRCKQGLEPEFLEYWMHHLTVSGMLDDFLTSTTIQHLTGEKLRQLPVLLPSLDEQHRIVNAVSSIDEVIQSTEQAVFNAKTLRSGLLSDLLSGEHEIPASYDSLLGAA